MASSSSSSKSIGDVFVHLCQTIAALRDPVTGCPWDLEQTHATLRKYMIEEAYEAAEVMEPVDVALLRDELGDVLLQVVLNSQLAAERKDFSIADVIVGLDAKMRRRHPHVFGNEVERQHRKKDDIHTKWEDVKRAEKAQNNSVEKTGVFSSLKQSKLTPALQMAVAVGKLAKKINFDWPDVNSVLQQFKSEVAELEVELSSTEVGAKERAYAELGDVFFSLGQVCRHMGVDPEICAMDGNKKFLNRFKSLEALAKSEKTDVTTADLETLERLWNEAKLKEKS